VAGYLPRSEGQLFLSRPGSNREGVFPRSALLGAEKVLFETRPGMIALHPALFWGGLPIVILFLLVAAAGFSQGGLGAIGVASMVIVLLIALAPLLIVFGLWHRTSYALTDQRVVACRGDTFDSVPLERISAVQMDPGSSTIVFQFADNRPEHDLGFLERKPAVVWKGVPGAPAVATYASSAVRYYRLRQDQKRLRESFVAASMEDRIVCEYCGGMIAVSSLNVDDPRCPRCTAPIRVAPIGI